MSAAQARRDLISALHDLAGAGSEDTDRWLSLALEAADRYAVALGRSAGTEFFPCCEHCEHDGDRPAGQHTVPCAEGCNGAPPVMPPETDVSRAEWCPFPAAHGFAEDADAACDWPGHHSEEPEL